MHHTLPTDPKPSKLDTAAWGIDSDASSDDDDDVHPPHSHTNGHADANANGNGASAAAKGLYSGVAQKLMVCLRCDPRSWMGSLHRI